MMLYFRTTSEYDYKDNRQPASEDSKNRLSKYPTVIDVKFSNGDRLDVLEFFGGLVDDHRAELDSIKMSERAWLIA